MQNHGIADGAKGKDQPSELPRVLVVDLSLRYGGASTRAVSIAKFFSPYGGMLAGIENSAVVRVAREQGVLVKIVGKNRIDPMIPFRIANVLRREKIQIVDTQNIQSKFWVSIAALFADFVFVSTLNSFYRMEFGNSWKSRAYHAIDFITNWKTDKFVAVSETIQRGLAQNGISADKIVLIKNSIELPDPSKKIQISNLQLPPKFLENTFLCVLVGRLVWAKGFDDFISAFVLVTQRFENAKAIIIGDGELRDILSRQIKELELSDHVYLMGHQDREMVLNIVRAGDVFVMPSRSEGIPYALLEAASFGKPVVATVCGGIPEVVSDGQSALLVPVGNISALSNAIVSLYEDKNLAQKLGSAAQKRIEEDYSLDTQMKLISTTYKQCLIEKYKKKKL